MHEQLTKNTSLSSEVPNLQVAWDSTSLGLLKECPYKYALTIIQGWVPKHQALPLKFGILYHSAMEFYGKARYSTNMSYQEALRATVRFMLNETVEREVLLENSEGEIEWVTASTSAKPGQKVVDARVVPWDSGDSYRNRQTLVRTVIWYLTQFENDPTETVTLTDGRPAVELSFRISTGIKSSTGEEYLLCGHLDRVVSHAGKIWVQDHKTSKTQLNSRYFAQYNPDNQMSIYTLAACVAWDIDISGVMVDAAQIGVNFARFQRGYANRTRGQIDEFFDDFQIWLKMAEVFAQLGQWPMNDKSCDKYGGCHFREICNKDPAVRQQFLQTHFKKQIWDPLIPRN